MVKKLRTCFVIISSLFITTFLLLISTDFNHYGEEINIYNNAESSSVISNNFSNDKWRKLTDLQVSKLSKLGQILFLNEDNPKIADGKTYNILIWKYGKALENRHIKHYTNQKFDPFGNCSMKNCQIIYDAKELSTADMVVVHLHRTKSIKELPQGKRNPNQIWTFLTDESPLNTFLYSKNNKLEDYNGIFNWSMSYRLDCDIPVPYGRVVALRNGNTNKDFKFKEWFKNKKQDVLIAIMGSNCGGHNHRWKYVKELEKYIPIDTYGGCGKLKCPGHFTKDCLELSKYKFYLSFENSNCDEYITEKLWWNAFAKDAIPIVMGGSQISYRQLLPPNSYIHVDDFASSRDLANYILYLNSTPTELQNYFTWKKYFNIFNEHGYFRTNSVHYCRMCEALNYNDRQEKIYTDLKVFWKNNYCHDRWDLN